MSGLQGYFYQNQLSDAVISAEVAPSEKTPLIYPIAKQGTGSIRVSGQYTGSIDKRYEVKIHDTAITNPIVSQPIFRGAGTGKIRDITATGLDAQKITVLCLSTGVNTTKASIEIEGVLFQAKEEGAEGNQIYIEIDDSMLTFTKTAYSTIKPLKQGDTGLEGQEWDFQTAVIQGDIVPQAAKRIAFGEDRLNIYLQYKKFVDGKWRYYFIPEIRQEVQEGKKVYFVSGGRTIYVKKGQTTEQYDNIVTIADFWQQVRANSQLIESPMTIDTSRASTSPACREFATKTDAYFLSPYKKENSSEHAGELNGIWVTNNAKTELIKIECMDNNLIGGEIWSVEGSSSGALGLTKTGIASNFGAFGFTIPQKFPKNFGTEKEGWNHKVNYQPRSQGVQPPPICFSMRLGVNAQPQTLILTYKKRPTDCICPSIRFHEKCLGLQEEGGEIDMPYTVPDLMFWSDGLRNRMVEAISVSLVESEEIEFKTKLDPYFLNVFKPLAQRIIALPEESVSTWTASKAYLKGETIRGLAANENWYLFECTTAGTSGTTEPTWTSTIGATVTDGTVVWKNIKRYPALEKMITDYKALCLSISIKYAQTICTWDDTDQEWDPPGVYASEDMDIRYDLAKYKTLLDDVLEYERTYGVKKNSIIADTCWQDAGDDYYWEVRGDKAYLPAFTDVEYYSTIERQLSDGGRRYESTKEFAFHISVPCGGSLLEGDEIEVRITDTPYSKTYQLGDVTYLPTIAKQNLHLHGGVTGDDIYVFEVKGNTAFPNYQLDRKNPQPYSHANLSFAIDDGIIPFRIGDTFEFHIEGGRFIWREDGGTWSNPINLSKQFQTLTAGIQIAFDFGVNPSFVPNDSWEILCIQENRAANVSQPNRTKWKGTGSITFSFSAPISINSLIIDQHNLTSARFQASNDIDFAVLIHDEQLAISELISKLFANPIEARYYRIQSTGARQIGYIYLGNVMRLSMDADSIKPMMRYQIARTEAKEPFALFESRRAGYIVNYSSFIFNDDYIKLTEMIEHVKINNDMPIYFMPNVLYPETCIKAIIDTDTIEPDSDIDMNAPPENRLYGLSLQLTGIK